MELGTSSSRISLSFLVKKKQVKPASEVKPSKFSPLMDGLLTVDWLVGAWQTNLEHGRSLQTLSVTPTHLTKSQSQRRSVDASHGGGGKNAPRASYLQRVGRRVHAGSGCGSLEEHKSEQTNEERSVIRII